MLKKILIIAYVLCFGFHIAVSQSDAPREHRWSLGVSAGDILHELFNGDEQNRSYPAVVLEHTGDLYTFQAGFRPEYNYKDTEHQGFLDSEINKETSLSGHLSYLRNMFSESGWAIKGGFRYEGGWSREDIIEDSGFDRVTTRRLQWNGGAGVVFDVRYFVHPRISFGTDMSLIYSYGESELQQLFTNFPEFDTTKDTVIERKLKVGEPMTIYIRFHL